MQCIYIENELQYTVDIPPIDYPIRLDALLHLLLKEKGLSREKIKHHIHNNNVYVNNILCQSPSKKIHVHDCLRIHIQQEQSLLTAEEGDIDVLYQDDALLVVNKPASLVVHPCTSTPRGTLLQRLLFHYPELRLMGGERPAIVHRLDKDTTGLLLIARTEEARYALVQLFSERGITKAYLAFVQGIPPEQGTIDKPIARDPIHRTRMAVHTKGKEAYTQFIRIATFCNTAIAPYPLSLLYIIIATGRTHQIRVHLSHLGFPLVGDTLYGATPSPYSTRPLLHAYQLSFTHPLREEPMKFQVHPPTDFQNCYTLLNHHSTHVILTGSAGSGKSTALAVYASMGIPCCSTDSIIKTLYEPEGSLWHYFRQSYGTRFFDNLGYIDKEKILQIMIQNTHYKEEIERVTHSYCIQAVQDFWNNHATAPYTVVEVPLYFESVSFNKSCPADIVITVTSPEKERIARMKAKEWTQEKIDYVLKNQYSDDYKKQHAHYCIDNATTLDILQEQVSQSIQYIEYTREAQRKQHDNNFIELLKTIS